jgi:hypothetical protein
MTHAEALELLSQKGFENGWALADGVLVMWEHDIEPPKPLERPTNAPTDTASSPAE